MSELAAIQAAARAKRDAGEPCVLATVMQVRGSAYRRPGARMLVSEHAWLAGSISGGCLEGDVIKRGFFRTRDSAAVLVSYDTAPDEDDPSAGYGLGCGGAIEVLLERISATTRCDPLAFIASCHSDQTRGVIAHVFRAAAGVARVGDRLLLRSAQAYRTTLEAGAPRIAALAAAALRTGRSYTRSLDDARLELFFEVIEPPPALFIFGAGPDARPVAELARSLGWGVTVCEPRRRPESVERFAGLADYRSGSAVELAALVARAARPLAVIMSHRYACDREMLGALRSARLAYLGVMGPLRRTRRMLAELAAADSGDASIHAPVGLDLGAETPAEIALSIIAEAQACLAKATAAPLRERGGAIHETPRRSLRAAPWRSEPRARDAG